MESQPHIKPEIKDQEFVSDISDESFSEKKLTRIFAVNRIFRNTPFSRSVIDGCYFRNCRFIDCDFTGAQILNSNFRGAQFENCQFRYTEWHKTYLEERFLDTCLPSEDNLARDLVRSLRVNFTEIGNYEAVNRASSTEVKLTGKHLFDAAFSEKSYYRGKDTYSGTNRFIFIAKYAKWKFLDLLWGNGESILKVLISATAVFTISTIYHAISSGTELPISAVQILEEVWGTGNGELKNRTLSIFLSAGQFIFFGLFMAILVKRLSRR